MSSFDDNLFAESNLQLKSVHSDANCNIDTHFENILSKHLPHHKEKYFLGYL